jgi:hypothetical protein
VADEVHVTREVFERLATGELEPVEAEAALEHIAKCPRCGRIYRGLSLLADEAGGIDPDLELGAPPRAVAPRARRYVAWTLAAAAAVLLLLLALPLAQRWDAVDPGKGEDVLRTDGEQSLPEPRSPIGSVEEEPRRFTWSPASGARAYRIELFDGRGELLWRSGSLEGTELDLPPEVELERGVYYWRVSALPLGGGRPSASPLASFDLLRPPAM